MSYFENPIHWLAGIVLLGLVVFALSRYFNANARESRRRTRSHRPVVTRKRGPSIRLAARFRRRRKG